ncbi:MAG: dihydroxyacetone kinase phosphoryl donor subunit DhaM [Oscillochloridaceae bacterium umkhey_bin13]
MIGILIISHSAAIAQGVRDLADQMVKGQVPLAAAGGTHDGELGTSADLITAAIDQLGAVDAILTLVDMGSAIMSAEMALEMSGRPFLISGAPLVEGAIMAAVEAMRPDATLSQVALVAARALDAKGLPLYPDAPAAGPLASPDSDEMPLPSDPEPPGPIAEATLTVLNKVGLHMRPAKDFVRIAATFDCTVRVRNLDQTGSPERNGKSLIEVLKLGVTTNQRIHVRAEGDDALAAVEALSKLVADNFGEALG